MAVTGKVKGTEAHRLAQTTARETGESLAKIGKRKGKANVAQWMAIAKRASHAVKRPYVVHGELLYDKWGLPK